MNIIACVDKNWSIGFKGKLLAHIKEDLEFFKRKTIGKIVVMGRKTYESLPKFPLPNRTNIILSKNLKLNEEKFSKNKEKIIVINDINKLLEVTCKYFSSDVFFIGGASLYDFAINISDTAYITKINAEFKSDTKIINVDKLNDWSISSEKKILTQSGIEICFTKYKRKLTNSYQ